MTECDYYLHKELAATAAGCPYCRKKPDGSPDCALPFPLTPEMVEKHIFQRWGAVFARLADDD